MQRIFKLLTLIVALSVVVLGILGGLALLIITLTTPAARVQGLLSSTTVAFSLMALGVGLGGALAWQATLALLDGQSPPMRRPLLGVVIGLWLLSLAGGFATVGLKTVGPWVFPLFYVPGMALPPLIALLWVSGQVQRKGWNVRWRDLILGLSQGGIVATTIAIIGELLAVGVMAVIAGILMGLNVIDLGSLQSLRQQLRGNDLQALMPLLRNPLVIAAVGTILVAVAPLVEEFGKGLTPLWLSYRRPVLAQALLWGVAGGAGFAIVEGLFNGAIGLPNWGSLLISRLAATAMHLVGGGLTGMGWWYATNHRGWQAIRLFAGAVLLHGLWNGTAGALALLGIQGVSQLRGGRLDPTLTLAGSCLPLLLGAILLVAISVLVAVTVNLPRRESPV